MKIYTRTGDAGETGLVGGMRIAKSSLRIAAIGEVDELNAAIGLARVETDGLRFDPLLERVQSLLFDLGAELASTADGPRVHATLSEEHVRLLERSMDEQTERLPPLRNFVLPGGSAAAAQLHLARCICRRAERAVLAWHEAEPVREEVRAFLNRLSDWLFVCARSANQALGVEDVPWKGSEVETL